MRENEAGEFQYIFFNEVDVDDKLMAIINRSILGDVPHIHRKIEVEH